MRSYERRFSMWIATFALLLALVQQAFGVGLPAFEDPDSVVHHTAFSLEYSEEFEQARWVAYTLTPEMTVGPAARTGDFRPDPLVKTGSAELEDYRGSGFDRGHLVPAADMKHSRVCMSETFYLSNMSPQRPEFNRGVWKRLEELVRTWAHENGELHVAAGPVLAGGGFPVIGPNRVAVPVLFYKVILDCREPDLNAIGFILPNAGSSADLWDFAVSVDTVEDLTGIDFYPELEDELEERLESSVDLGRWSWGGKAPPEDGSWSGDLQDDGPGYGCDYWLNVGTGVRHNPGCRNFGKSRNGRCCGPEEGRACGICGG
ncbi:MAG: DNA/RNA non-specific endonuclease [Desulfomonilia bacterium]